MAHGEAIPGWVKYRRELEEKACGPWISGKNNGTHSNPPLHYPRDSMDKPQDVLRLTESIEESYSLQLLINAKSR